MLEQQQPPTAQQLPQASELLQRSLVDFVLHTIDFSLAF